MFYIKNKGIQADDFDVHTAHNNTTNDDNIHYLRHI